MCCDILLDLIATGASDETNSVHITTNFTNDELDCLMDFLKRGSLPVKSDGTQQLDVSKTEAFSALGIDLMWVSTGVRSGMLDGTRRQPVTHSVDPQTRMKLAAARGPEVHLKKEGIKNEPAADSYYFEPSFMPPVDNVEVQYEDEDYEEKPAFIRPADTEKKKGVNKRKSVQSGVPSAAVPSKKRRSEKEDPFFFPQEGDRDLETLKYQCQNCVRGFRDLDDYRQHFLRHMYREDPDSKDRPYTCLRCFNFRGKHAQVESHMRGPCKEARYKDEESLINYFCVFCPDGGSVHDTVEAFNKHLQHKHPEKDDALVRIHKCVACGSGWPTLKTLRRHMLKEGPYHDNKCVLCHQVVETWTGHLAHVEREHSGVGFRHKCGSCGSVAFDTKTEMKNHRKFCSQVRYIGNSLERNPEMTTCRLCETELEARIMPIHEHFNKYHLDDMVKCVICGKGFASKNSLQLHVRRDHAQTMHQCELCEKSFPLINQLKAHKMSVHTANELKRFHCDTCGKGFATKPEHHRHLLTHDPMHKAINAKKRMCDLCGAEVNERSYRKHLQRMHGTDSVKCDECEMTFKHPNALATHMKSVHTYSTCELCGESIRSISMKTHKIQKHTDLLDMPYICRVCDPPRGFAKRIVYEDHTNIHTGRRPYNCDYCSQTFTNSSNKFKHMRHAHKGLYQSSRQKPPPPPSAMQLTSAAATS